MFKDNFCTFDSLLDGISYDDLIETLRCNEKVIDEETVNRVFNELLQARLHDAKHLLKERMQNIIKECEQ